MPDGSRPDSAGYDEDFYLWTQQQARRLRSLSAAQSNEDLDWGNVAEEIESLGKSDRRAVRSRLHTILEHLYKLRFSTARDPRFGWTGTVTREREELRLILEDSPSLRRGLHELLPDAARAARRSAVAALIHHGEPDAAARLELSDGHEVEDRVLDDGYIPSPPDTASAATSASA